MTTNDLAEMLIRLMPISSLISTLVFLLLWVILAIQGRSSRLEFWINALFLMVFISGVIRVYLAAYLALHSSAEDIKGVHEWGLIVFLNVAPLLTAFAGFKVAQWTNREIRGVSKKMIENTIMNTGLGVEEMRANVSDIHDRVVSVEDMASDMHDLDDDRRRRDDEEHEV